MSNQENKGKIKNFVIVGYENFDIMEKLTGNEYKLFMMIFRNTVGWQKEEAYLANTYLAEKTGISVNTIRDLIESLVSKNMLSVHQIGSLGMIKQIIKINLDVSSFVFKEKNKLKEKVKNFFTKKDSNNEPTKEVFSGKQVVLTVHTPPTVGGGTAPTIGGVHLQSSEGTPPTVGDNIYITHKNNYKHPLHIEKKSENKKPNLPSLEIKEPVIKNNNAMDDSKILNNGKTSFSMKNLSEKQKHRADILISFGIETKNKRFSSYLEIDTQELKDMITDAEWNLQQGKIRSSKQAFLCFAMDKWIKEKQNESNQNNQNDNSNDTFSINPNKGNEPLGSSNSRYLQGEKILADFCLSTSIHPSMQSLNGFASGLGTLITTCSGNKEFMLEFKKLGITKTHIENYITRAENYDKTLYTHTDFPKKEIQEKFYILFEDPDLITKNTTLYPLNLQQRAKITKEREEKAEQEKAKINEKQSTGFCGFGSVYEISEKISKIKQAMSNIILPNENDEIPCY